MDPAGPDSEKGRVSLVQIRQDANQPFPANGVSLAGTSRSTPDLQVGKRRPRHSPTDPVTIARARLAAYSLQEPL